MRHRDADAAASETARNRVGTVVHLALVEFAILGVVEARADGSALSLGGPKQRALLALLLLHANEPVSRDRLIDGLWGAHPPPSAAHTLDDYVSRLRKALGAGRIERRPPGYLLRIEDGEADVGRFEALVREGRERLAGGDAGAAAERLRAALGLWRGPALADVLYAPFAAEEAERLEERRLSALEDLFDAELALGASSTLVAELEKLTRAEPLRERPLAQLMLALYRAGRQAEALAVYQAARRRFAEELGLELGSQLRTLERQILAQDPVLGRPRSSPTARLRRRGRSRRLLLVAVAGVLVGGAVTAVLLVTRAAPPAANASNRVIEIGGGGASRLAGGASLVAAPAAIGVGGGSLWLAEPDAGAVVRVDRTSRRVVETIPVGGDPGAIAVAGGSVWVASVPGASLTRVDPATDAVTQRIPLGGAEAAALAFGLGRLWVADSTDASLLVVDPRSGSVLRTVRLAVRPTALAVAHGSTWVADYDADSVSEVDARSGQTLLTIHVGGGPAAIAVGRDAVWVANELDSTVSRIDPATGTVAATIAVGSGPLALALWHGSVWVANEYSQTVSRVDPGRNAVAQTVSVGGAPTALAAAGGLFVGSRPTVERHGGTLVLLHQRPIAIDPALQLDLFPFVSDGLTRDGLVTVAHTGGPEGARLVPDLAVAIPEPTDGGLTYTFRLRPGIRYSDGRPVRAGDFRRELERVFRLGSPGSVYFADLVGAGACNRRECDLVRGVVADDAARTVTFHLRAPDDQFLSNLTLGGLSTPVPSDTPFRDVGYEPIPGTGPYEVASASRHEIRYVRNPFFQEWSHAAQPNGNPDTIVMRFGLTPAQEVHAIERGTADWTADGVPAALLPEVLTRFHAQLHSSLSPGTAFLQLNTALPPFDDVRVRRALNFAVDRAAVARRLGGPAAATPTCQLLPPGIAGYRRYCPYTRNPSRDGRWRGPDLARARRLVAASGTGGEPVTVWGAQDDIVSEQLVPYAVRVLRRLGYRARPHLVPQSWFQRAPQTAFRTIQMTPPEWIDTSAYGFLGTWFLCGSPFNHTWFCDPRLDRAIRRAQALDAAGPQAASARWARIDRELVDRGATVPLVTPRSIDFVSARVHNYEHNAIGFIADQASVDARKSRR
jgi:YVTN family beta-propeller protein